MEEEVCTLKGVLVGQRERCYSGQQMLDTLRYSCFEDENDIKKAMTSLNDLDTWAKSLNSLMANSQYVFGFAKHFRTNCQQMLHILSQFFTVMRWLYQDNGQNVADFRLIVHQELPRKNKGKQSTIEENTQIAIKCLNAAFVFNDIKKDCSSLILTSGTLSPMKAFATEMNVDFKFTIEGLSSINVDKQVRFPIRYNVALRTCDSDLSGRFITRNLFKSE